MICEGRPGVWESSRIRRTYRIGRAGSLCPGSGADGDHDRSPSRSRRAVHRLNASEKRRARSQGEGPIPYESRTRIAAARRRASMFADYPRRGQASPLQLSTPNGAGASPPRDRSSPVRASARPQFLFPRRSFLVLTNWKRNENKVRTYTARFPAAPAHGIRRFENGCSSRTASGYRGFHG